MDNSVRGKRVRRLTGETANALLRTLVEIVELVRLLLSKGIVELVRLLLSKGIVELVRLLLSKGIVELVRLLLSKGIVELVRLLLSKGIVELVRLLLSKGYAYVLPGKFSSDRIEGEFGICRQSSGGNYLISAGQVFNSLKLQRIKLFSKLDIETNDDDIVNDCCIFDLQDSEQDLELVESCFEDASALNVKEKLTLCYICGYVTQRENRLS